MSARRFAPTAKVRAATEEGGRGGEKAGREEAYVTDGTLCAQDPPFQPREGVSPATL